MSTPAVIVVSLAAACVLGFLTRDVPLLFRVLRAQRKRIAR